MKVQLFQTNLTWENPELNLHTFQTLFDKQTPADLILLPEMFTTGFSMNPEKLASRNTTVLTWMIEMAKKYGFAVCGSIIVEDNGQFFNRLYFVEANGGVHQYDKRHLFTMGQEPEHYSPGKERVIIHYKGWKILPLICYDLRFPVFSRNDCDYDLLLYVANWPEKRSFHWSQLLLARAIENQSFVLGCNRTGADGNGIMHSGDSAIIDYKGQMISSLHQAEGIVQAELNLDELHEARSKFPVLKDRDLFSSDWK
ncbi:MAG: amidohydrolase [Bacteroidetes bacterium]|nr:amidohydrolase [Bacteroidota bacterium]